MIIPIIATRFNTGREIERAREGSTNIVVVSDVTVVEQFISSEYQSISPFVHTIYTIKADRMNGGEVGKP